jgi:hypothetical protein
VIIHPRIQDTKEFEQLDEISARYIRLMTNRVLDVMTYKNSRHLSQSSPSTTSAQTTTIL